MSNPHEETPYPIWVLEQKKAQLYKQIEYLDSVELANHVEKTNRGKQKGEIMDKIIYLDFSLKILKKYFLLV